MTNLHKGHKVLGRYCWDCKCRTSTGIPGWPMGHNGEFVRYSPWTKDSDGNGYTESIIWANGDSDSRRQMYVPCSLCGKFCGHPVTSGVSNNDDSYREIYKSSVK